MTKGPSTISSADRRTWVEDRLQSALRSVSATQVIPRRKVDGQAPLSHSQWRMWFQQQLVPDQAMYNVPLALRLQGEIKVSVLEASLREILRRHESLRTTFEPSHGSATQKINQVPERFLSIVDLSSLDQGRAEEESRRIGASEACRPFDPATGPMARAVITLLHRSSDLLLNFHHAVIDAWSFAVFFRELKVLYEAHLEGRPSRLPELPIQYSDYAVWQREQGDSAALKDDADYWKRQLRGVPMLDLPTDGRRPAVQSHRGQQYVFQISETLRDSLVRLSEQEEVTLFVLLQAAYAVLLMRYTGQEDIAIGSPVANRRYAELEDLIGLFVNTLVLRNDLSGNPGFRDFLRRTRAMTIEGLAHQDFPLESLVEDLVKERDLTRPPLFQVMFSLQNVPSAAFVLPNIHVTPGEIEIKTAKVELSLVLEEETNGISCVLEYSTDLFEGATARLLALRFATLLTAIVQEPDMSVWTLPLLSETERRQLVEWAQTSTDYPRDSTVDALFTQRARQWPTAIAVESNGERLSYQDLDERSNRLAQVLRDRGVQRESRVGVCLERSAELVITLLAILKARGVYVPLDVEYPTDRLRVMIEDAGIEVLVSRRSFAPKLPHSGLATVWLDLDDRTTATTPLMSEARESSAEDLAYVMYTSGSTGVPKGVGISHRAIVRLVIATDYVNIQADDVVAQVSTTTFDAATFEIWGALLHGARLSVIPREQVLSPKDFAEELARRGITMMFLTTALFNQMAREAPSAFRGLRTLLFGGEMVDTDAVHQVQCASPPERLLHVYGPTENTTFSTWHQLAPLHTSTKTIPVGRPIANSRAYVLDRYLNLVPVGFPGELYVGGDGTARGYLNRPELTAASFVPDLLSEVPGARLYRTGDRVRRQADGNLEFLGRVDYQIKLRGFRIELGEIEAVLAQHPRVRDCVVMVKREKQRIVAYVACENRPGTADLRTFMQKRLPNYMVPATFIIVDFLPLNVNGKVDRSALEALSEDHTDSGQEIAPPRNQTEEVLLCLWLEELGLKELGIHDNFFEVGGHSLLATKLISRIRQAFGIELPLRCLFEAPRVADLSALVEAASDRTDSPQFSLPTIVPNLNDRNRPFPLTDVQQAYWVGRSAAFELGNVGTHLYIELDCPALNTGQLEAAWQKLIDRHEMLRAVISADGEQQILPHVVPYEIKVTEFTGTSSGDALTGLAVVRERLSHQIFDPAKWPLFELRATCMPGGRVHLHFSLDALISDAWSLQIIFRDLLTFYKNPAAQLSAVDLSFRDYVLAEVTLRESELYQKSFGYWHARLASIPAAPDLPLLVSPRNLDQPRFVRRSHTVSAGKWSGIKGRASSVGLTPSVVLLTAFAEVLATWSKSRRFTLNLTLFNRHPLHPQVDEVVGDFTSLTLLEVDCTELENLEQRGRRLQKQLWDDLDRRYVTGIRVLRELARKRGGPVAMPVVFTSMLSFADSGKDASESLEELGELTHCITQTPQVWLDHQVAEINGALEFNWDFVEELFPPGMVAEMFNAYCGLLDRLAVQDEVWKTPSLCLVPVQQLQQRTAVNATFTPRPAATLHGLFQKQASAHPDRAAVLSLRRELTYGALAREVRSLASRLRRRGAAPQTLVAVVMEKGWEQVVAVLAILEAGAAYLPIDPGYPSERVAYLLKHGQAQLALTQPWLSKKIDWPEDVEAWLVEETPSRNDDDTFTAANDAEALAYVIYTSGSTGLPKGVMIDHRGAVNTILDINERFNAGPGDRVLALSSLSFDLSVYDIFGMLAVGGAIVLPSDMGAARDPGRWLELLDRYGVTCWNSVPALMELFVEQAMIKGPKVGGGLRLVMLSGDWIPVALPDQVRSVFPSAQIVSLGGATEASIWSILYPIADVPPEWKSIPYGKPMLNQTFHVLNSALEPCPLWTPGELYIGGIGVALGYWQDEARTRAAFQVHPRTGERLYRTGDLGRYLPDGNIEFMGREDFQVKVHGYRVELGEIEAALTRHSGIQTAVVAAKGKGSERRLVAYYVPREPGTTLTDSELRSFLEGKLPRYMVPSSYVSLAVLPLSANGKVDRGVLPDPRAPQTPAAAVACDTRIVRLVEGLLKMEGIAENADLLAIGATSIDMIRMLNKIEGEFGVRPDTRDFYDEPTMAGLARMVAVLQCGPGSQEDKTAGPRLSGATVLTEPVERELFKQRELGLRQNWKHARTVVLPGIAMNDEALTSYIDRCSHRQFLQASISQHCLAGLLRCLGPVWVGGARKYLYPSAGGLYAVQTYLHLKKGAVEGLASGAYYYHPVDHRLICLAPEVELSARIHEPQLNRPIFQAAGFSIFLVPQLNAIAPLYGDASLRFATLEAGHMGQALMTVAAAYGIGLCPIGEVEFGPLRAIFDLDDGNVLIHSFVGGAIDVSATRVALAGATVTAPQSEDGKREEWEV
jgi:amino acid adenylation domain-containing protein